MSTMTSLNKEADIKKVLSKGKRIKGDGLSAAFIVNGLGVTRIAIPVKKTMGNAVARNRMRRRLKEAVRAAIKGLGTRPRTDIVIFPSLTTKNEGFIVLCQKVRAMFASAGII